MCLEAAVPSFLTVATGVSDKERMKGSVKINKQSYKVPTKLMSAKVRAKNLFDH